MSNETRPAISRRGMLGFVAAGCAAIAQACYLNGVPFVVIRAISDKPGGTELVDYQAFEAEAAAHCAAIVRQMVGNMG